MRTEAHVHGTLFLCKGVSLGQVETALTPWLEYLEVDSIKEAKSMEQTEPGIVFDKAERILDICWTGEVGQNFHHCIEQSFHALGTLTERASEVEITYYHESGDDEIQLLFVGSSPEIIHQAQRRRMVEDVSSLLNRHFQQTELDEVITLINQLFDKDWNRLSQLKESEPIASEHIFRPANKHLH